MVAIVKYNAGNVRSVQFALQRLSIEAIWTDDPDLLRAADKVIFPGVGEASSAMHHLRERGLDVVLRNLRQPVLGICLGLQLFCRHSEEGDTRCLGIFDVEVRRFHGGRIRNNVPPVSHIDHINPIDHIDHINPIPPIDHINHINHIDHINPIDHIDPIPPIDHINHINHINHIDHIDHINLKVPHIGWNTLSALRGPLFEGLQDENYVYFVHSFYAELHSDTIAQTGYGVPFSAALQRDNFYAVQFHPEKSGPVGQRILNNFLNL